MKLLIHPANQEDLGICTKPSPSLRPCILPWASIDYKTYPFGGILRQQFTSKHFSIYHFVIDVAKPVQLHLHCSQPYVILQFTLEGTSHGRLIGGLDYRAVDGKTALFYLAKGLHPVTVESGRYRSLLIRFNNSMLAELAEDMTFFENLRKKVLKMIDLSDQLPALTIGHLMVVIIERMRTNKQRGGALNFTLKTSIFELVNLYNLALENAKYNDALPTTLHRTKLVEMYDAILYKPNIQTCKLSAFSKKYFLSPITLSRYFHQMFNVRLADFVMQQVMQKAAWYLIKTDKPISEIGEELGYSSVSNFSRSFGEYYGQSPVHFRKNQDDSFNLLLSKI